MQHRRIIKRGPIVLATNEDGSMDPSSPSSQGLFLADTRFLSTFQLRIHGSPPVLLGSSEEILFEASYLHTNSQLPDIPSRGIGLLQRNTIEPDAVKVNIGVANWSLKPTQVEISVELASDFFDSFEARGVKRLRRGLLKSPEVTDSEIRLGYTGLDHIERTTVITCEPAMLRYENNQAFFCLMLDVNERKSVTLSIRMEESAEDKTVLRPRPETSANPVPPWFARGSSVTVNNLRFDAIVRRSIDDLEVLLTEFPDAWVPAAGLPRFSVPFGRDSILTGLQTLVWNHCIARDVLRFLAHRQGTENNPWNYEQPGKIMHELHTGELARLKEVPFGRFYGSVDSTPLFLVLGGEYIRWTGDVELYRELKESFEAAWKWIDDYGDIDGSGYVQYKAHTPPKLSSAALTVGLFNQGWKDSALAVVYGDGTLVTDHPVALAEVQGYLYRALTIWAEVFKNMPESEGMRDRAPILTERAAKLRQQFNDEFWMPDKGYYAMALDGHHRHVDSITSNPGHCLWSRLIDDERAADTVNRLMDSDMMSAWGIRTMASTERAYNPFSYHDGSIWPFENALIAAGLKKYGFVHETERVFNAMVDASLYFEYRRWPEVYCGVAKEVGGVLARQPDASRPQAWSAGASLLFVQTMLGVAPRCFSKHVDVTPALPAGIDDLSVEGIAIAGSTLGLRLVREGSSIFLEIKDNPGDLDIVIHPVARNSQRLDGQDRSATSG